MEDKGELVDTRDNARELFTRHGAHYEVWPYFVVLDERTFGLPRSQKKIHAGFELDVYGTGSGHGSLLSGGNDDPHATVRELCAACRDVVTHAAEYCKVEVIPFISTLLLNVKRHFEPEAWVRIRITHSRGLGQPAGATEERALADVMDGLDSLGAKRT